MTLNSVEITFFVPCYNEEPHIRQTLQTILDLMKEKPYSFEVLVVDDASSDASAIIIEKFCRDNAGTPIVLHRNTVNRGLGYNYLHSADFAKGRYYMLVNGDNDIPQDALSGILDQLHKADIIVPYVENQGDRPWIRQSLSHLFTFLVNILAGHKLRYYNGPVIHLTETVKNLRPETMGFGYQAELLCRALNQGYSYCEVSFRCVVKQKTHLAAFRLKNIISVLSSLGRIFNQRLRDANARKTGPRIPVS